MKKLMMIPLVAVGMITMSGCSQSPVKETAKNDAINLANLDTTVPAMATITDALMISSIWCRVRCTPDGRIDSCI